MCSLIQRMDDRVRFYERSLEAARITPEQQERIWRRIEKKIERKGKRAQPG